MEEKSKYGPGQNPKSRANLRKGWKPGQSGNPKGRPKGTLYLSEALREQLHDPETVRQIAMKIIKDAKRGNYNAINLLAERTEGKVPLGLTTDNDVTIRVVYENDSSQAQES